MKPQIISFQCTIKNKAGLPLMSSVNCNVLNKLDADNKALSGLVQALQDLKKGETRIIHLSAEEAYGVYDPQKIIFHLKNKISKSVRPGEFITIVDRNQKHRLYRVVNVQREMVTLDGNHPLAGQDLIFEISAFEARDALDHEIEASKNLLCSQVLH